MKKELLVPAQDFSSLEYAIANGADAIYLGVQKFNARAFAKNFSEEEIKRATRLCHLYGVKLYVTMNTLIKDQEVEDFLTMVSFLHQEGVDALIMQDFGMISLVREVFPNLEIHASTQANVCTEEAMLLYHKLGVKRIVLPREMSLEEINRISVPIEKEVFIHGALCMSYSGCCLMSSMIGSRSGNRGECTGCCRLFYHLYENDQKIREGYLLSTKELNTSSQIQELFNSNITSFKIEGRMKSPLYVGFITRLYRKLLDGREFDLLEEEKKLRILFNREFTLGHLFHDDIRNPFSPNHLGLLIGEVLDVTKKRIKVKLSYPLYQEDGLRFQPENVGFVANFIYDSKGRLVSKAESGDVVYLDHKVSLSIGSLLYKTTSKKLLDDISMLKEKKIPITLHVKAKVGDAFTITVSDHENTITLSSILVEEAKTAPLSLSKIEHQLSKMGDTPFVLEKITFDVDSHIFLSIKEMNELRRNILEKLREKREEKKVPHLYQSVSFSKLEDAVQVEKSAEVTTMSQVEEVKKYDFSRIYIPSQLQEKAGLDSRFFVVESFGTSTEEKRVLRKLYRMPSEGDISDYTFNVMNIYTVYYLLKLGYKKVTLSVELSNEEIVYLFTRFQEVFHFTPNLEVIVYGRVVVMNIFGNVLEITHKKQYSLRDEKGREFPVVFRNGYTYLYHFETFTRDVSSFSGLPISFRYHFFDEGETKIRQVVNW